MQKLLEIMAALRDRHSGCPWDVRQTFETIAPYTIEEAYEVADAIARGDRRGLKGELGDLLFQVVFHARMAEEAGDFDFNEVVEAISAKLLRRHPHVFGSAKERAAGPVPGSWERIKADERAGQPRSEQGALAGVAAALPALRRATKLGERAAAVGFDWPDDRGVRAKLDEELAELDEARERGSSAAIREEIGDLLFTVANLARHLEVDAEQALSQANRKFEARFGGMETAARARGTTVERLEADALEALWEAQKQG